MAEAHSKERTFQFNQSSLLTLTCRIGLLIELQDQESHLSAMPLDLPNPKSLENHLACKEELTGYDDETCIDKKVKGSSLKQTKPKL